MAILKRTKNKGILFWTDEGDVYVSSVAFILKFLESEYKDFERGVIFSKMPNPVPKFKVPQSNVFRGKGDGEILDSKYVKENNIDITTKSAKKLQDQKKFLKDRKVEW